MKKIFIVMIILLIFPTLSYAGVIFTTVDLEEFTTDMSQIMSFFAGLIAMIAFVIGVGGGHK